MDHDPKIYEDCGKAIRKIYDNGGDFDLDDHVPSIRAAKLDLFTIIHELTVPRRTQKTAQLAECVGRALKDLHRQVEYSTFEKIVLDVAVICETLSKLEDGLRGTDEAKVIEARFFCEHMKHEMSEPP